MFMRVVTVFVLMVFSLVSLLVLLQPMSIVALQQFYYYTLRCIVEGTVFFTVEHIVRQLESVC